MAAIVIIALICAVIAEIATASRQIWSFARDNGLPFSPFLAKVRTLSFASSDFVHIPSRHHHHHHHFAYQHKTSLNNSTQPNPHDSNSTGLPKLPHPPQRSHRLLPLRRRHQPHQPRLLRRPQRRRLPHPLRPPRLLRPVHRLHPLEAAARRTAAAVALVARSCGHGHQRHRTRLPRALFHLLLFPDGQTRAAGYDELERRHVWGHLPVGDGFLRGQRKEGVCPPSEDSQAGYLMGTTFGGTEASEGGRVIETGTRQKTVDSSSMGQICLLYVIIVASLNLHT